MICTHCGRRPASGEHTLLFAPPDRERTVLDLPLCDTCLGAFLDEPCIERVERELSGERRERGT